ncbi:MAG: hypothetical protein ACR2KE_01660 [Candidatus Nanopelagicales bacterium]
MPSRPASVTVVAVLLGLVALGYLIAAITSIVLWVRPDGVQRFFDRPISDGYWALSALLFLVLAILLAFVARSALAGDSGAGLAISLLALLGVAFSLFAITEGYGWGTLVLSLAVLAANQTSSAQQWYRHAIA